MISGVGTSYGPGAGNFQFDPSNPFGSGLLALGNCVGTPSICDAGAGSATAVQILDGQLMVTNSFPNPDLVSFAPLSEFSGLAYANIRVSGGVNTASVHDSTASSDASLATPEPRMLGLMTVGSLALGLWRKRKTGRTGEGYGGLLHSFSKISADHAFLKAADCAPTSMRLTFLRHSAPSRLHRSKTSCLPSQPFSSSNSTSALSLSILEIANSSKLTRLQSVSIAHCPSMHVAFPTSLVSAREPSRL
jgi:hypothetical protein